MMEDIMTLVAEWFSLKEMKALQGVCMLTSVWATVWQNTHHRGKKNAN